MSLSRLIFCVYFEPPWFIYSSFEALITCNLYMNLHDYYCKLRHKIFHSYACYHILSAYLSFHTIFSDDIKMYHFRDNCALFKYYSFITFYI